MTDNTAAIFQWVAQLGISTVLLIIVFKWLGPQIEKLFDAVLDKRETRQEAEKIDGYRKRLSGASQIEASLERLREELGADRAYIFEYHNGGHTTSGLEFLKASVTHERVAYGIRPMLSHYQNLPVGIFSNWNDDIIHHREVYFEDIEDLREKDESLWALFTDRCVKSVYIMGLYDENGLPIGFAGVDYCGINQRLTEEEAAFFYKMAAKISGMLAVVR